LKDAAHRLWPGISIVVVISALAFLLARVPALAALGLSALTIAIVVGALLGNIAHRALANPAAQPGFQFAQKTLLQAGVALYGLNLSLQQLLEAGPAAIAADLFVVTSTIFVGWWVGFRWLKMDRDTDTSRTALVKMPVTHENSEPYRPWDEAAAR